MAEVAGGEAMTAALLSLLLALRLMGVPADLTSMSVSGYSNANGAPPYQGLMRSGEYTRLGVAACGPALFAQRAILYVEGVGWLQCLDTGGEITEGGVDVWQPTEAEAWAMERHQMNVVVVRP
jgi:3D (Asp-Asp-Asp) domain-containing protein